MPNHFAKHLQKAMLVRKKQTNRNDSEIKSSAEDESNILHYKIHVQMKTESVQCLYFAVQLCILCVIEFTSTL